MHAERRIKWTNQPDKDVYHSENYSTFQIGTDVYFMSSNVVVAK